MKRICVALPIIIAFATACAGQDSGFSPNPAPIPDALKNKAHSGMKEETIVVRTFRYLKASQNPDGSWGGDAMRCKATALAFLAFNRCGGTTLEYEETINKAQAWLRQCQPETDEDKLAVVIAIAGMYTSERSPSFSDEDARQLEPFGSVLCSKY